jgi:hypothetical protein
MLNAFPPAEQAPVSYDSRVASVVVCADSEAGLARGVASVEALGARVAISLPIVNAAGLLDELSHDAVFVDICEDPGDALDRLLDRLDQAAKVGRHRSVVALVPELIDIAAARAPHPGVELLCSPSTVERTATLGLALAGSRCGLREGGIEAPLQLRRLSEEVGRIARALADLSRGEKLADSPIRADSAPMPLPLDAGVDQPTVASLRAVIRARRLRDQYFAADLFADPAWDMLLDLLLARMEGRLVAVSSLCIAAAVPPTTALRWIKRLTDEGLFERTADPRDGRRVFIDLADDTAQALITYLRALPRLGIVLG